MQTVFRQASDSRPLSGWDSSGALIDDPRCACITDIVPACLEAINGCGDFSFESLSVGEGGMATPLLNNTGPLSMPQASRLCLVLIDGMGYNMLRERSGHCPTMRKVCLQRTSYAGVPSHVRTCIPSSTACAIPAFMTGSHPATTAMIGYEAYSAQAGTVINMLQFRDRSRRQYSAEGYYHRPTVFDIVSAAGCQAWAYGPKKFERSGMSTVSLHGSRFERSNRFHDTVTKALRDLRGGAALAYVYSDAVDHTGHGHGWQSEAWLEKLEETDRELERLLDGVPQGTLVVITADHGMVDVARQTDIATHARLAENLCVVAGEPRALHLYATPGTSGEVQARWQEFFGEDVLIVTRKDAPDFYGAPPTVPLPDLTVFSRGGATIVDSRIHSPAARAMKGVHGSLTPQEMEIPLGVYVG